MVIRSLYYKLRNSHRPQFRSLASSHEIFMMNSTVNKQRKMKSRWPLNRFSEYLCEHLEKRKILFQKQLYLKMGACLILKNGKYYDRWVTGGEIVQICLHFPCGKFLESILKWQAIACKSAIHYKWSRNKLKNNALERPLIELLASCLVVAQFGQPKCPRVAAAVIISDYGRSIENECTRRRKVILVCLLYIKESIGSW